MPDNLKNKLSTKGDLVFSPKEALSQALRNKNLMDSIEIGCGFIEPWQSGVAGTEGYSIEG